jgi:Mg2+ and Co2+ transporters
MVAIFYKSGGQTLVSSKYDLLEELGYDDVLWMDLTDPSGEEKRAVEEFLNTTLQSRAQAEEIESSSRYSETETTIFANTNFMIPGPENYSSEAVSFILCEGILVSLRQTPLRSFTDIQRKLQASYRMYPTGYHIMVGIMENRIDMDADMIEILAKEIAQLSRWVGLGESLKEDFLLEMNQMQENTMIVRENVVDKQRLISSVLRSDKFPSDIYPKLEVLHKDIESLIKHTNFSFERLEYLQNTVLGLINVEQNKIMKIFTFVSLLLMPATLIASIYGMNVDLPILESRWDFVIIMSVMVSTIATAFFLFRRKKMLK